ncbi:MAG: NAD-dependent epimerase/dehydratase family protein, partial [Bacteroidota bacterium]
MKQILIIGGTLFVGRVLVEKLLKIPGYELTLFNRGRSNTHLFPRVKRIVGDRYVQTDLDKMAQQDWDVVIDISSYYPLPLEYQMDQLKGRVGRYIYVSTASVYDSASSTEALLSESTPLVACPEELKTDDKGSSYSARKAECERVILKCDDLDKVILRPGLIVGPHDYTDRLYYWIYRVQKRFAILLPDGGRHLLAYTDVDDFAQMMIQCIDIDHQHDVYNATSYLSSVGAFVAECKKQMNKRPNLVDADVEFLDEAGIKFWSNLPLWINKDVLTVDSSRLIKEFRFTPSTIE